MFASDLIRLLAIDFALLLVIVLTTRITFATKRHRLLVQFGIALVLLEDAVRWAIAFAVALVPNESLATLDLIRQWSSWPGAAGAFFVCLGLLPIVRSAFREEHVDRPSAHGAW